MGVRGFTFALLVLTSLVWGGGGAAAQPAPPSATESVATSLTAQWARPNIIVVLTDDQRWDTIAFIPTVRRRLAGEGITFTHAFVTTPLCCPSRASILTGRYVHNHGVWTNDPPEGGAEKFDDSSTIATWLQRAGYTTSLVGKYLNGYGSISPYIPPGWDDWHVFVNTNYYNYRLNENGVITRFGSRPRDYSTDVLRSRALDFIRTAPRPFFLVFAPFAPHQWGPDPIPARRHVGTCEGIPPYRPPSFNEADVSDKPSFVQALPLFTDADISAIDRYRKAMLCSLKAVDEAVAAILDALGPELDSTVVIFTSDNGYLLGEHRMTAKACAYEECARVPLVIRYPPLVPSPGRSGRLVLNIDLAPTIAELAGVAPPAAVNGRSLVPLLSGANVPWRRNFLIEWLPFAAVRSARYKYVEHSSGERELYDLGNDRYELNNVVDDPAYAAIRGWLAQRLAHLKQE